MTQDSISTGPGPGHTDPKEQRTDAIGELAHEAPPTRDLAVDASLYANEGVRRSPTAPEPSTDPVSPASRDATSDTGEMDGDTPRK